MKNQQKKKPVDWHWQAVGVVAEKAPIFFSGRRDTLPHMLLPRRNFCSTTVPKTGVDFKAFGSHIRLNIQDHIQKLIRGLSGDSTEVTLYFVLQDDIELFDNYNVSSSEGIKNAETLFAKNLKERVRVTRKFTRYNAPGEILEMLEMDLIKVKNAKINDDLCFWFNSTYGRNYKIPYAIMPEKIPREWAEFEFPIGWYRAYELAITCSKENIETWLNNELNLLLELGEDYTMKKAKAK